MLEVASLGPGEQCAQFHAQQYGICRSRHGKEKAAALHLLSDDGIDNSLILSLYLKQKTFVPVAGQSQFEEKLREIDVSSECGKFGIIFVSGFYIEPFAFQECDHVVCHPGEFLFREIFAVEIEIFRESVYPLYQPKVRPSYECQFAYVRRCRLLAEFKETDYILFLKHCKYKCFWKQNKGLRFLVTTILGIC